MIPQIVWPSSQFENMPFKSNNWFLYEIQRDIAFSEVLHIGVNKD